MDQHIARQGKFFSVLLLACALLPGVARGATFQRGDTDNSGSRDLTDAIRILNFLFLGGPAPVCDPVADVNADGTINLTDPVSLLGHLFLGNPAPGDLTEADLQVCAGVDPEAVARGMKEYEQADANGNAFSCALCHSLSPEGADEVLRPGHTLLNALHRPSFKGAAEANFLGAVNVCRNDWMVVAEPPTFEFKPWTETEPRYQDLLAFLRSVETSDSDPALQFEIVAPAVKGPSAGDAVNGCKLFNRSCMVCHGINAAGRDPLGPSLIDVTSLCAEKPDLCLDFRCEPSLETCLDNPDYLRYRIRLSGPNHPGQVYKVPEGFSLSGSVMPFWTKDRLSDAEVEDLVAYILAARQGVRSGTPINCIDAPNPDGKVLRKGALAGRFHGVAGDVEELDTRKIRLTGFSYDGGGILVRIWLYKGNSIRAGQAIGPDLFGQAMSNTTLVVDIPAEISSDSFDHVSIWCVSARQDFGNAELVPVQ